MPHSNKTLAGNTWIKTHATHGTVTITRSPKASTTHKVLFQITLVPATGTAIHYSHSMAVDDSDTIHGHKSSFGYGDIDFPEAMQGKGIGYIYHHVAAVTAAALGVDYLVVDTAVSDSMRALCANIGMKDSYTMESYEGIPQTVSTAASLKAANKGWH